MLKTSSSTVAPFDTFGDRGQSSLFALPTDDLLLDLMLESIRAYAAVPQTEGSKAAGPPPTSDPKATARVSPVAQSD
jgi:hypothetical protein